MSVSSEKERTDFHYLLNAYLEGKLDESGINELFDSINEHLSENSRILLQQHLLTFQSRLAQPKALSEMQSERMRKRLLKEINGKRGTPASFSKRQLYFAAAAVFVILLGMGIYALFSGIRSSGNLLADDSAKELKFKNDIPPGDNKAILTLGDGSTIILDSVANGELSQQGETKITKLDNGVLDYETLARGSNKGTTGDELRVPVTASYNTITTPRGGQYQVLLQDGTRIWLNSASSLRFPTVFSGKRIIELQGEAYIEAASNATDPFEVRVNDMTVQVLGTEFNIMAYPDEKAMITTLVTGAVQVIQSGKTARLKPGEHAIAEEGSLTVKKALMEEEIAWKNGLIQYSRASIQQIMRQVSRWYNVDVIYEGDMSNKDFACAVSRRANVSQLLKMLELTGAVHFSIDGNKIIVRP